MRKLFTFLFAALMSVGMYATTVTWDNSTLSSIYLHGGDSFTKDGVTLTVLDGMIDGRNFMGFSNDASFKFSTSLGNFTKIEITGNINALGGSGWTQTILGAVWTGEANETTFGMSFDNVSQIVFTIGDPAPTTHTLKLVADPTMGSVVVTNLLGSGIVDNGNGNYTVPENAQVTILATPNEGYVFSGWLEGNVLCDFIDCGTALNTLDNPLTFTLTQDAACKAEFAAVTPEPEPEQAIVYDVAQAIAAADSSTISENDSIIVRGVITKIEFKGTNFSRYGSANIYVADATGAEGSFEFYNCYSLLADTFRTSDPAYDATSSSWTQFQSVTDGNGVTVHVGDTVIAEGKYKKYNTTYELNTGCYLIDIKPFVEEAPERELTKVGFHFPELNQPADNNIEMVGSFEEGTMDMEKIIATGWFLTYSFIHAAEEETFKFRDKTNNDLVLCKKVGDNWVQAIFTFGDLWAADTWHGEACMLIEEEISTSEDYAWMEGMPEPEPEPEPVEATVVFAANGNTKEVTVALPHTFWCDLEDEDGELDGIIQELYALPLGGYCDFFYDGPEATGNPAVTAGADEDSNHFITISEAFEGTATVSGKYNKYTDLDEDMFNYSLTISIKGAAPTAVESIQPSEVRIQKVIRDGMLLIERDGKIYNVLGAKLR